MDRWEDWTHRVQLSPFYLMIKSFTLLQTHSIYQKDIYQETQSTTDVYTNYHCPAPCCFNCPTSFLFRTTCSLTWSPSEANKIPWVRIRVFFFCMQSSLLSALNSCCLTVKELNIKNMLGLWLTLNWGFEEVEVHHKLSEHEISFFFLHFLNSSTGSALLQDYSCLPPLVSKSHLKFPLLPIFSFCTFEIGPIYIVSGLIVVADQTAGITVALMLTSEITAFLLFPISVLSL